MLRLRVFDAVLPGTRQYTLQVDSILSYLI